CEPSQNNAANPPSSGTGAILAFPYPHPQLGWLGLTPEKSSLIVMSFGVDFRSGNDMLAGSLSMIRSDGATAARAGWPTGLGSPVVRGDRTVNTPKRRVGWVALREGDSPAVSPVWQNGTTNHRVVVLVSISEEV